LNVLADESASDTCRLWDCQKWRIPAIEFWYKDRFPQDPVRDEAYGTVVERVQGFALKPAFYVSHGNLRRLHCLEKSWGTRNPRHDPLWVDFRRTGMLSEAPCHCCFLFAAGHRATVSPGIGPGQANSPRPTQSLKLNALKHLP